MPQKCAGLGSELATSASKMVREGIKRAIAGLAVGLFIGALLLERGFGVGKNIAVSEEDCCLVGGQSKESGCIEGGSASHFHHASGAEFDALLTDVGHKVSVLRRQRELTQEQLAQRAGCSTNTVIAVENGKRNVTVRSLAMISAAVGVHFADLFSASQAIDDQASNVLAKLSNEIQAAKIVIERMQAIIVTVESVSTSSPLLKPGG